jgi:hypothetical protein
VVISILEKPVGFLFFYDWLRLVKTGTKKPDCLDDFPSVASGIFKRFQCPLYVRFFQAFYSRLNSKT